MTDTDTGKTPGQAGYEAYDRVHGVRTPRRNWELQGPIERDAWEAAVQAGIDAVIASGLHGAREDMSPAALALKVIREREQLRQDLAAVTAERDEYRAEVARLAGGIAVFLDECEDGLADLTALRKLVSTGE